MLVGEPVEALIGAVLYHLGMNTGGNFAKKEVYHKLALSTNLAVMDLYNEFGPFLPIPSEMNRTMPRLFKILTFNYFEDRLYPKCTTRKPALGASSKQWSNIPNMVYALVLMASLSLEGSPLTFFPREAWLALCKCTKEGNLELKKVLRRMYWIMSKLITVMPLGTQFVGTNIGSRFFMYMPMSSKRILQS